MSLLDSRLNNLDVVVNVIMKRHGDAIKKLEAEVALLKRALAAKPDDGDNNDDDGNASDEYLMPEHISDSSEEESEDESQKEVPRVTRSKKHVVLAPESDTDDDSVFSTPVSLKGKGKKRKAHEVTSSSSDSSSESDSDDEEDKGTPRQTRSKKRKEPVDPAVGDIFSTNDGFCVHIGDGECGWLYRREDLPDHLRKKVAKNDLVISDHDYIFLDYDGPGVELLPSIKRSAVVSNIRHDVVYLVDSETLREAKLMLASPERALDVLSRDWECQTHFGLKTHNHAWSQSIVRSLAACEDVKVDKLDRPYHGQCSACNTMRWNSHRVTIGDQELEVGDICKTRIELMADYAVANKVEKWYVFGFVLLETVHALDKLKSEATNDVKKFIKE